MKQSEVYFNENNFFQGFSMYLLQQSVLLLSTAFISAKTLNHVFSV